MVLPIDAEPLLEKLAHLDVAYALLLSQLDASKDEASAARQDELAANVTRARENFIAELAVLALMVRVQIARAQGHTQPPPSTPRNR